MGALQPAHWLLILFLVLLIFGPRRLVETGRALGGSWRALVAAWREHGRPATSAPAELPAQPCPRCGVWSAELARFCTRCGAALPS